jgi:alanine-synthesizing transaminase
MDEEFQRIQRLPPYIFSVTDALKRAARARGEDIIDFGMGNPDQPTPPHIVAKLIETVQRGDTHRYSQSKGIPRLRRAITDWYLRRYDVALNPEKEAIVTLGSKEGLAHLAQAILGPGDSVLVPNPSYPIHPYGFVIAGADVRHVPLTDDVDFFSELESAILNNWPKPKVLVLKLPGKTTPHFVDLEFLERVVGKAKTQGNFVFKDID